jgi:hypothetical protein
MDIGRVRITPAVRTTIADPNYKPKPNVAISELNGVNVTTRNQGDVLVYDANTDNYISSPISTSAISITSITGGHF